MEQIQRVVRHWVVTGILDITVVVGVSWWIVCIRVDEIVWHNCHLLSLLGSVLLIPIPLALLLVLFLLLLFVFFLTLTDSRLLPMQIVLTVLSSIFCNVRWICIGFNTVFCNFAFLAFLGLIHVTPFVLQRFLKVIFTGNGLVETLVLQARHESTIVRRVLHFTEGHTLQACQIGELLS